MIEITLEQLLNSFKKKSIQDIYSYMVNTTFQNYYDNNKMSDDYKGLTIHNAADIDILIGFNKLKVLRHYKKYATKETMKIETYHITDIGDKLAKALFIMTGYKHESLEDLIGCEDCIIKIKYDKHGNILSIYDKSPLYEIMCQLISVIPLLTIQLTGKLMVSAVEYLVLLQEPTNVDENYGSFKSDKLYSNCRKLVEQI